MTGADFLPLLAATAAAFLALLFARAALHKLTDFTEFTGFVADYKLLPERFVAPVSALIVAAECAVVVTPLIPGAMPLAGLLGGLLLAGYGVAMAVNIVRGRDRIECGCGGAAQPLSWALVARNAVLVGVALVAVFGGPVSLSLDGTLAALATGVLLLAGFLLVEQILANDARFRMKP